MQAEFVKIAHLPGAPHPEHAGWLIIIIQYCLYRVSTRPFRKGLIGVPAVKSIS